MRITDIYLGGFGPFEQGPLLHLDTNDERVLFLGISGSGKTSALRGVTHMWLELKRYIDKQEPRNTLTGNIAMVLETDSGKAAIILGDERLKATVLKENKGAWWLHSQNGAFSVSDKAPPAFSNMCMLDGDMSFEPSQAPWLITDDDVKIMALKDSESGLMVSAVNSLLVGKTVAVENGDLTVYLPNGQTHDRHALSMGERRIVGLCYLACVCLKKGGVLLMDEPDVHLHPSQMMGLVATLENAVLEKRGQILLISHHPEIWNRYDMLGKVIVMGGAR